MSSQKHWPLMFRIVKGTHVSHFHQGLSELAPKENFYEQEKPLWWGEVCKDCARLADEERRREAAG
jgi:hypothetical protein